MRLIRILILEDDLEALSKIFNRLAVLENKYAKEKIPIEFSTTVLAEHTQVEEYINNNPLIDYDLILLDRDCKVCGSFHVLDINRIGVDKIIGISSVPDYNEELSRFGVTKAVLKDYKELDVFVDKVMILIEDFLRKY